MRQAVGDIAHYAGVRLRHRQRRFEDAVATVSAIVEAERSGRRAAVPEVRSLLERLLAD